MKRQLFKKNNNNGNRYGKSVKTNQCHISSRRKVVANFVSTIWKTQAFLNPSYKLLIDIIVLNLKNKKKEPHITLEKS